MRTGIAMGAWAVATLVVTTAAAAEYRQQERFELGSGGKLTLRTEAGGAEVRGGAGETAVVTVTSKRADFTEKYEVRFEESPGLLSVVIARKGPKVVSWFWEGGPPATVVVELPRRTSVEVSSSGGGVVVEGLEGSVKAESSGGGARVADVTGDVVSSSSGGGVHVERIRGSAKLDSSGGSVVAREVSGDLESESSGGGVRIEEAGGAVVASSSGGSVRVRFAAGNARGGEIDSSGGGVTVAVDPRVGLDIDASASGGDVDSELPVTVRGKIARNRLRGPLNGGGALLKVRSSGGGVALDAR
jgi:hypothetical protein